MLMIWLMEIASLIVLHSQRQKGCPRQKRMKGARELGKKKYSMINEM